MASEAERKLTVDDCDRIANSRHYLDEDCRSCPDRPVCVMRANRVIQANGAYSRRIGIASWLNQLSQVITLGLGDLTTEEARDLMEYKSALVETQNSLTQYKMARAKERQGA